MPDHQRVSRMPAQEINYDNVVELLIEKVPELRPLLDKHLEDQCGELLQHVFFGDLTRYVLEQMHSLQEQSPSRLPEAVRRILDFLEIALTSSDTLTRELVGVSFIENLDPTDPAFGQLKSALNPNLRRDLEHYQKMSEREE